VNVFSIILLVTAFVSGFLAFYTLQYRKAPAAMSYSIMMFFVMLYCFGYAFEISSTTLPEILFWLRIEYLGIAFLPTVFIILAIQYVGKECWLNARIIGALVAISLVTLVIEFTNFHHLFYTGFNINREGPFPLAEFSKGPWYWVHQAYSNMVFLLSSILYTKMLIKSQAKDRIRAGIMLLSAIMPWFIYGLYEGGLSPYGIDLNPFSAALVGALGLLGLFRFQLLGFEPLAIEKVVGRMRDGVIIIDQNHRIVNFNASAQLVLNELNIKSKGEAFERVLNEHTVLNDLIKGEGAGNTDLEINGSFYQVNVSPVYDNQDRFLGTTMIFSDITERKMTEQLLLSNEVRLKELNDTKDKFFNIIAHDLRGPFSALVNLSEILVEQIEGDQKEVAGRIAKSMVESSKLTFELLDNLLEWSKIQRGGMRFNPDSLSLKKITERQAYVLGDSARQKKLNLKLIISEEIQVLADSNMLKTILRNLISNAIKYSNPGGEITVSAQRSESRVEVSVRDYGTGISLDDQQRLFRIENKLLKPGTNNERGTGLGLLLCKEFVKMHGGEIWVESSEGKGSCFYFSLDAAV
jgi:signal transduction histidine kinase